MEIFERVIKGYILEHLINDNYINEGQHGFVPRKSTQTQPVAHYNRINENLIQGKRIDSVFLEFAKAFDKVNHRILLAKIAKQTF